MRGAAFFLVLLLLPFGADRVWAHGDPPEGEEIHIVDGGWVYVTNFGVMTSEKPDVYVCEEAFYASERFRVAPLGMNRWATFSDSLATITDDGCDFGSHRELPGSPLAVARHRSSDRVAMAIAVDGVFQIWIGEQGGQSWTELPVDLDELRPSSLGFLSTETLLLVGYVTEEESRGQAVITEIDIATGGRTDHPTDQELRYPELLDTRGDDFLWHARRQGVTEIFWSHDGDLEAGHFVAPAWPRSGALSDDGQFAYLGGVDEEGRGVFRAQRDEPSSWEEIIADHRALCMTADGPDLLICGHRLHDGHDLARWTADGELHRVVDFRDLRGIRDDCPEDSRTARTCPPVWPELAVGLGIELDEEQPRDGEDDTDGCSTTGAQPHLALLGCILMLLFARAAKNHNSVWASIFGPIDHRT